MPSFRSVKVSIADCQSVGGGSTSPRKRMVNKKIDPNLPDCHECIGTGKTRKRYNDDRTGSRKATKCPDCGGTGKQQ